jgi:hypothetical protein
MNRVISAFDSICRRIYGFGMRHSTKILLVAGVALLTVGLADVSLAQSFDDSQFVEAGSRLLELIEGSFGALIMIVAGLVAIIAAAMGAYKAAMAALIVAVGAFILRSMVTLFFDVSY